MVCFWKLSRSLAPPVEETDEILGEKGLAGRWKTGDALYVHTYIHTYIYIYIHGTPRNNFVDECATAASTAALCETRS